MTTKLIGVREFRQNIASLYKKAVKDDCRYIILNRNKPIFKVEFLTEKDATLEMLAEEIQEARSEAKKGDVFDFEDVCKELGI